MDGGLPQNFCTEVCIATTNSGGDPHFIGFNQEIVTYQGECTLVLLMSPGAALEDDDVIIHVRTTRKLDFSYISAVAMKIGEYIIEVTQNAELIVNGDIMSSSEEEMTVTGLPFHLTKQEKGSKKKIVSYAFDIGNDRLINVQANRKRHMLFVSTKGNFPAETHGILGSPSSSKLFSRDGKMFADIDVNEYGESWQVKDTDEQLFREAVGPQYPDRCLYDDAPGATATQLRGRRKLQLKKVVTREEALEACESVLGQKRELCVADAIAMGDLDLKDDPFYVTE